MTTQAERRILHINSNLENLNDTQIAFEDFRDETGLSYFGGAFGGRYDNNTTTWGSNISRFARYNSSPVFQSLVFDNDPALTSEAIITLTTATEMTANHVGTSATSFPTPDNIGKRLQRSVNIGYQAGQVESQGGQAGVNIGERAGQESANYEDVFIGLEAGRGATLSYSVALGSGAGSNSSGNHNVIMGTNAKANGSQNVSIGQWCNIAGSNNVSIGRATSFNSPSNTHGVFIGNEVRYNATAPSWKDVMLGYQAGYGTVTKSYNNVFIGTESGTEANTMYTVAIGTHAGSRTQNNTTGLGNVFMGWEAGDMITPVTNPYRSVFTDLDGMSNVAHNGFNIGIGGLALERTTGATNIGIGYGAGGVSTGNNFQNISIGTFAGQSSEGYDKINIGTNAGFGLSGDKTVMIGRFTGQTSKFNSTHINDGLGTGTNGAFELGDNVEPQLNTPGADVVGNTRMSGLLLSGNFNDGWIWANQLFGMAPLDQAWVDTYNTVARRGHMVYNNTINKPQYYDGTAWQNLGGTGASSFTALNDTPANYTGASARILQVNSAQTGVEFGPAISSGSEANGHILQWSGSSNAYLSTKPYFTRTASYTEGSILMQVSAQDDGGFMMSQSPITFVFGSGKFETAQRIKYTGATAFETNDLVDKNYVDTQIVGSGKVNYYTFTNSDTTVTPNFTNGDYQKYISTNTSYNILINVPSNMVAGNAFVMIYEKPIGSAPTYNVSITDGTNTEIIIPASESGLYMFSVTCVTTGNYVITQASKLLLVS